VPGAVILDDQRCEVPAVDAASVDAGGVLAHVWTGQEGLVPKDNVPKTPIPNFCPKRIVWGFITLRAELARVLTHKARAGNFEKLSLLSLGKSLELLDGWEFCPVTRHPPVNHQNVVLFYLMERNKLVHKMDIFRRQHRSDLIYLALADNSARDVAAMVSVFALVVALHDHDAEALGQPADETNDAGALVALINEIADEDDLVLGRGLDEVYEAPQLAEASVDISDYDRAGHSVSVSLSYPYNVTSFRDLARCFVSRFVSEADFARLGLTLARECLDRW